MSSRRLSRSAIRRLGVLLAITVPVGGAIALAWFGASDPPRSSRAALVSTLDIQEVHVAAILEESWDSVFVGYHEGVVASVDGGKTWTDALSGRGAMALAPAADGSLLAAGHGFIGRRGDDGELMPLSAEPPDLDIHALTRSPSDPDQIWLATGSGSLIRSRDGGASWTEVDEGPIVLLAAYGDDANDLYAIDAFRGLTVSDDGGQTWGEGSQLPGVPVYAMAASMDGASVLVGTGEGAFLSNDGGRSWEEILESSTAAVAIDADAVVAFLVTRDGEVYRYRND